MKKITLLVLVAMVAFAASPALINDAGYKADYEFSTAGMDAVPASGGSPGSWGEWFITAFENDSGEDVQLLVLGFPCCGPPTDATDGWLVWTDVGGLNAPAGDASTRDYGGGFTPVDSAPDTVPPTTYTYVDITSENIVIPAGNFFVIGYDNTGYGGLVPFTGHETWAWYGGVWDADSAWGITSVMQVTGVTSGGGAVEEVTWGQIKNDL